MILEGYFLESVIFPSDLRPPRSAKESVIGRSRRSGDREVTIENGSKFYGYKEIERLTEIKFYFASPYHY